MANSRCVCESWQLNELANALKEKQKDNKKIVVPMFQRGLRWDKDKQQNFVDSLVKGYPVGTLLFFKRIEENQETFILVDGLQRSNCIKAYLNKPTDFIEEISISDELCEKIKNLLSIEDNEKNINSIRSIINGFMKEQKKFQGIQCYAPAIGIANFFQKDNIDLQPLIDVIDEFFKEKDELYNQIARTHIPIVIYSGKEENLPEIFERINSQGIPLDKYEIYAASWPIKQRFHVENDAIVEAILKKYDNWIGDDFYVQEYNREEMRNAKELNAFEYLFGLSKYLTGEKYDLLAFNKKQKDDEVNSLAFELVNACLNDTDKIKILYQDLYKIPDINIFENALYKAIDFVCNSISSVVYFKGNNHSAKTRILHSKYQILSMISATFREMFKNGDYSNFDPEWEHKQKQLKKNLRFYYALDIIKNYWKEGGSAKLYSSLHPNRYLEHISFKTWDVTLDSYFEDSMNKKEIKQVASPGNKDYVILNCIYSSVFSAKDQLSIDKFDVEHIAPKEQMKKILIGCNSEGGLPISSIANLCYLPEGMNRSKKNRNFYQDKKWLEGVDIKEVEEKYSFISKEDLAWMAEKYEEQDVWKLQKSYKEFCDKRFKKLKEMFFKSMEIVNDEMKEGNSTGKTGFLF